jgi:phage shock protein A
MRPDVNHYDPVKELQKELEEQTEQENRHILMSHNVEQTLGKILCYPWYKDDKKNFPGATEEDGVCVGEDTIETLADRAAERIRHLEEEISALREKLRNGWLSSDKLAEELKDRDNRIADLTASRDEWRISAKVNADAATKYQQRIEELQDQFAILLREQHELAITVDKQTLRIAELVGENEALKGNP